MDLRDGNAHVRLDPGYKQCRCHQHHLYNQTISGSYETGLDNAGDEDRRHTEHEDAKEQQVDKVLSKLHYLKAFRQNTICL